MQIHNNKTFSPEDLDFMRNGEFFDRKEEITKRVQALLVDLQQALKIHIHPKELCAPEHTDFVHGQLVRGERFHQRPYVYLDFPKFFSRQAMFAYRSFFWWGWDFVFAFILSGPYLDLYKKNLVKHLDRLAGKDFYLSLAADPWEWRKTRPETLALTGQSPQEIREILSGMEFLKIQYFVALDHPLWVEGGLVEEGIRIFDTLKFVVGK
ncbi:MAG: hypothetical protein L0Y56_05065 [Nitrospira sp.]|nr:hypothetical protein [Nitrospira sp.]